MDEERTYIFFSDGNHIVVEGSPADVVKQLAEDAADPSGFHRLTAEGGRATFLNRHHVLYVQAPAEPLALPRP